MLVVLGIIAFLVFLAGIPTMTGWDWALVVFLIVSLVGYERWRRSVLRVVRELLDEEGYDYDDDVVGKMHVFALLRLLGEIDENRR